VQAPVDEAGSPGDPSLLGSKVQLELSSWQYDTATKDTITNS